jgi:hypothetical protein
VDGFVWSLRQRLFSVGQGRARPRTCRPGIHTSVQTELGFQILSVSWQPCNARPIPADSLFECEVSADWRSGQDDSHTSRRRSNQWAIDSDSAEIKQRQTAEPSSLSATSCCGLFNAVYYPVAFACKGAGVNACRRGPSLPEPKGFRSGSIKGMRRCEV